ncbi:hypothetical protein GCM10017750_28410 [Streptomyces racemochromogenes]
MPIFWCTQPSADRARPAGRPQPQVESSVHLKGAEGGDSLQMCRNLGWQAEPPLMNGYLWVNFIPLMSRLQ